MSACVCTATNKCDWTLCKCIRKHNIRSRSNATRHISARTYTHAQRVAKAFPLNAQKQRPRPTHSYQCFERFHMFTVDSVAQFVVILMLSTHRTIGLQNIVREAFMRFPRHLLSVSSMWIDSFIESGMSRRAHGEHGFCWRIRYPHATLCSFKCDFSLSLAPHSLIHSGVLAIHTVRFVDWTWKAFIYCVDSQRISLVHHSRWFEHFVYTQRSSFEQHRWKATRYFNTKK